MTRKEPLDEFTIKRLSLKDYALILDEDFPNHRSFLEVYHDKNQLMNIEKISVLKNEGQAEYDAALYLSAEDVRKLLPILQKFVDESDS